MEKLLTHKLHMLVYLMDKAANDLLLQHFKLTYSHFLVLLSLQHAHVAQIKDVVAFSGLSKGMISRLVSELEHLQLARQITREGDKRSKYVQLTKNGETTIEKMNVLLEKEFFALFDGEAIDTQRFSASVDELLRRLG